MSRELEYDGHWEGDATYSCDQCGKESNSFRFESDEVDRCAECSKEHRAILRKKGWITTQVNGHWKDFCCEACRNDYIRKHTK